MTTISPISYPGGKTRAAKQILSLIPEHHRTIVAPFIGGGSVEIALANRGAEVFGSDAFGPLANFWQEVLEEPYEVADWAETHMPMSKELFHSFRRNYHDMSPPAKRAAVFFMLNKSSFAGTTFSGGYIKSDKGRRLTYNAIDRLRDFRCANLSVEWLDYREALARHPHTFAFIDPPYPNGGMLYGVAGDRHNNFNHGELAHILRERKAPWLLCYNDCELVRNLYWGCRFIKGEWKYGMTKVEGGKRVRASTEVLILPRKV